MQIDLSALDRLTEGAGAAKAASEGKHTPKAENGAEGLKTAGNDMRYVKLEAEQRQRQLMAEAYKRYQDNIKQAGMLRCDITKGIQRGEDPAALLLLAIEAISRMTGDRVFYTQNSEAVKTIYGALGNPAALMMQKTEAEQRLTRLEAAAAIADQTARRHLAAAITAHKKLIEAIEADLQTDCNNLPRAAASCGEILPAGPPGRKQ